MMWGSSHTQCHPTDSIDIQLATLPTVPIPGGPFSFAPGFRPCDQNLNYVDFDSILEANQLILLVGFSGSYMPDPPVMRWLETVDSVYNLTHFMIYVTETRPDTSCLDSICPYSQFTTCPAPPVSSYCQSQTIKQRHMSSMMALDGYKVRSVIDNAKNEWWFKYSTLPMAGYLIRGRRICKSWSIFNVSNFPAHVNQCTAVGIEDKITSDYIGTAYDGNAIKRERMTYGDWLKSDWIWFSDGVRKYRRE